MTDADRSYTDDLTDELSQIAALLNAAQITGADRAARGVPLTALMHAYRIGFQLAWREFMAVAHDNEQFTRRAVLAATERMWLAQDAFIVADTPIP